MATEIPKYVQHNEKLTLDFLRQLGVTCAVTPATARPDCAQVNRAQLFPFGYNPSIALYHDSLIMAYRWHSTGDATTKLAMAELDNNFGVVSNQQIALPQIPEDSCVDDPRLFYFNDRLHCSFVVSTWPQMPPKSVVKYGPIVKSDKGWIIPETFQVNYGKNDGTTMEKNWIFFQHGVDLFAIYHNHPEQIVIQVIANNVLTEHRSPTPFWGWGNLHAGTTPLPYKGKLLRFVHSRLDNEPPPWFHRYYIGACLMEPEPPFKIIAIRETPVVSGSEEDDTTAIERASCHHRKANVVFPGGAIIRGDEILLSLGVNDCQSIVLRLKESDLGL